jgi:hypothetical protein
LNDSSSRSSSGSAAAALPQLQPPRPRPPHFYPRPVFNLIPSPSSPPRLARRRPSPRRWPSSTGQHRRGAGRYRCSRRRLGVRL